MIEYHTVTGVSMASKRATPERTGEAKGWAGSGNDKCQSPKANAMTKPQRPTTPKRDGGACVMPGSYNLVSGLCRGRASTGTNEKAGACCPVCARRR